MEDDVLPYLDERAAPQLREDPAIQSSLLDAIDSAQVRIGVTQPGPADEPVCRASDYVAGLLVES